MNNEGSGETVMIGQLARVFVSHILYEPNHEKNLFLYALKTKTHIYCTIMHVADQRHCFSLIDRYRQ